MGQRVGVGWQRSACLECEWCVSGQENLCAREVATCVDQHGGFAERIRVDGRFAFPIPESLASEHAAPLLCGGVTVYAPLSRWVRPAMRVGVVGIGGLGHLALQFARAMGCEVTAISTNPEKEAEARSFGAHRFVATREAEGAARGRAQPRLRALDGVSRAGLEGPAADAAPERRALPRRRAGQPLRLDPGAILGRQLSVTASAIGGRPAVRETLEFAARHGVAPKVQLRPLAEANAALGEVRKGQARYRVVLVA